MRRRRNSGVELAAGYAILALIALVAVQIVLQVAVSYPREGVILLASIGLGFVVALARKWKR